MISQSSHAAVLSMCSEEIVRRLASFYLGLVLKGQLIYRRKDIFILYREIENIIEATRRQRRTLRIILRLKKNESDVDLNVIVKDGSILAVFLTRHDNPLEVIAYGMEALSKAVNAKTLSLTVYEIPPKLIEQVPVCVREERRHRKRRFIWI